MKKVLLGIIAIVAMFSLVACGEKNEVIIDDAELNESQDIVEVVTPTPTPVIEEPEEQVGVGNTDEGMIALVIEQHYLSEFPDVVEEVVPTRIKVYTEEEIAEDESLKDYTINEGDIVFDIEYDLKIVDGYEDMMSFTAGAGEIDGQWIRNKANVGIARSGDSGYTLDAFGTAF